MMTHSPAPVVAWRYTFAHPHQTRPGATTGTVPVYLDDQHAGAELTVSCAGPWLAVLDWADVPASLRGAVLAALQDVRAEIADGLAATR